MSRRVLKGSWLSIVPIDAALIIYYMYYFNVSDVRNYTVIVAFEKGWLLPDYYTNYNKTQATRIK